MTDDEVRRIRHDLRASVNTIVAWAELLKRGPCDEAGRVRAGETIARHAHRLADRINVALELWMMEGQPGPARLEAVRLPGLLHAAIRGVHGTQHGPPTWQLDFDSEERYVSADPQRLKNAMITLLSHAASNAPQGEPIHVALRRHPDGTAHTIEVRDGGPMVDAQLGALVAGHRVDVPASDQARAFDLSLLLVRNLIAFNNGRLDIDQGSNGGGPTFRVTLPSLLPSNAGAPEPAPLPFTHDGEDLQGLRVMVVDDEPDAREALEGLLRFHGAHVASAGSVSQALDALEHEPIDVLLADIAMPGRDGFDLIAAVRAHARQEVAGLPAAAVTAFCTVEDRRRALAAGFQQHLAKPVEPERLLHAVLSLVRGEPTQ